MLSLRPHGFPLCQRIFTFVCLCSALQSCRNDGTEPELPPEPKAEFRLDRFSGRPVADEKHATAMIVSRNVNAPLAGETAPDGIAINATTGKSQFLHNLIGKKPAVLIFGSTSCSNFDMNHEPIGKLCQQFGNQFDFIFIYIREAHPKGGYNPKVKMDDVDVETPTSIDPSTIEDRINLALQLKTKISSKLKCYVDTMDDALAVRWGAWPDRVFVVSPTRKVIYSGGPGPWHFNISKDYWHSPPPPWMESIFRERGVPKRSLEEFLGTYSASSLSLRSSLPSNN